MLRIVISGLAAGFFIKINGMTSNLRITCSCGGENDVPVNRYRQDKSTGVVGVFADEVDPPWCDTYYIGKLKPGLLERIDYPCG